MASADILRAAHTAGPWGVIERNEHWLIIQDLDLTGKKPPVRSVTALVPANHLRAEQNAKLICAAPDLLSIAKRWSAIDGGAWHNERYEREREELLADTHAAIAAAEAGAGR